MSEAPAIETAITFGPFQVLRGRRLLTKDGEFVRLGARALDLLLALLERPGELVSKNDLMKAAWPSTKVIEANLPVNMNGLRRALGDGEGGARYIVNEAGRGYRFAAPVSVSNEPAPAPGWPAAGKARHNLPASLTHLVGRDDALAKIQARLSNDRMLTIVGPGGAGKTALAIETAKSLTSAHRDGVWLVDLAAVEEEHTLVDAVASALGIPIVAEDPRRALVSSLRNQRLLLVLDNCEQVIESAAVLAIDVLKACPEVSILATSREPLRIEGESVFRLGSLECPPERSEISAAECLASPAARLFVERVSDAAGGFELQDRDAVFVGEICRHLDGLPLAIEFAAAWVDTLAVKGLAARLDDRFRVVLGKRRASTRRHSTIGAALDWSHDLLSSNEQAVFRRLGVFTGGFTLEAATSVLEAMAPVSEDVSELVFGLISKSLVTTDRFGAEPRLRLFETTRAYAAQKLEDAGEAQAAARPHAQYYRDALRRAEAEAPERPDCYQNDPDFEMGNIRAALDWAFSAQGDGDLGIDLTVAAIPLWFAMSMFRECRSRVQEALSCLPDDDEGDRRLRLCAALGASLLHTRGPVAEALTAWRDAMRLSESLGDAEYRLRTTWGLWNYRMHSGELRAALAIAEPLASSSAEPEHLILAERMAGSALHFLGDQLAAEARLTPAVFVSNTTLHRRSILRFHVDPQITGRGVLARVLWLRGLVEQAANLAEQGVNEALDAGHTATLLYLLIHTSQTALIAGDKPALERYSALLLDHASRSGLPFWLNWAEFVAAMRDIEDGEVAAGLRRLQGALGELDQAESKTRYAPLFGYFATGLARAGEAAQALVVVQEAIDACRQWDELWSLAELLRAKGELLAQLGASGPESPETCLRRSLAIATEQGALSWELRAATSLARLAASRAVADERRAALAEVYGRFTEGFGSRDLLNAQALLVAA